MNTQVLKKSREVLKQILREKHDDIDSNTKSEVEALIEQIDAELSGNSQAKTTKREVLETFGVLLSVIHKGAELLDKVLSIFDS
ncbi:hypothetical protein N473_04710 [Pseudoalteromonas luteoviolacea CPMOR-1]|uniref:Uncharacterized protein n=1 Tax=Pseudoalteromonas luteoviolacea CPMOR-1 TaxID=1365248 RepID=A0A167I084_9GAMM|nr:hypothetical protein [Pseudoalteromonas luteoviolacea]KZN58739.1 hypothetical protein N473_04710 [Pseudoalteromonas luteoviolacea CPMOR-1]